jgi:hypothetical protein
MCKPALFLLLLLTSAFGIAANVPNIESASTWKCTHDLGTPGSSSATTSLVANPSKDGEARRFDLSWSEYGGERCSVPLEGLDTTSTSFTVDLWWFITDLSHVNNLEFDLNQVLANRDTVIYGTECSLPQGHWKFTTKAGKDAHWNTSNARCSRSEWTANTWHHLILQFHRDDSGVVTYDSVSMDGDVQNFNDASGPSNFALRWYPPGLLKVNFQIDGDKSSSATTAYLDQLTVTSNNGHAAIDAPVLRGVIQ